MKTVLLFSGGLGVGGIILICIAALCLMLLLVSEIAGGYMYRFAVVRGRGKKKDKNYWYEEYKKPGYITDSQYKDVLDGMKYIRSLNEEKVEIKSSDGLRLKGRLFEKEGARGVAILVHGYRSSGILDFACSLREIYERGFSCIVIDHRGHCDSDGGFICFGVPESDDLLRWAEFSAERYPALPVILFGVSMGASTVLMGCDRYKSLGGRVVGVVADCGYTSPEAICKRVLKNHFGLPPFPVYYSAVRRIKRYAGFDLKTSAKDSLSKLAEDEEHIPVLIIHGEADDFVPTYMSHENFSAFREGDGRAFLFTVEGAGHALSFLYKKEEYLALVDHVIEIGLEDFGKRTV